MAEKVWPMRVKSQLPLPKGDGFTGAVDKKEQLTSSDEIKKISEVINNG